MVGIHIIDSGKLKEWYRKHRSFISIIALTIFLYLFIFSLELMESSLKMFGKEFARSLIQTTANPVVGLFIGILSTSIFHYRYGVLIL
jgi:sodium-dependent phosphate cotransporter